jgi:alkylated DNA repair dioxygenase AlkB
MPKSSAILQADLFGGQEAAPAPPGPEGLRYHADLISAAEEQALARDLAALPFTPFNFHGYLGHRQVVSFGLRYNYDRRAVEDAASLPDFLEPLRSRIADFAERPADDFVQCLVNQYREGAGIGWHRDKPQFGDVVGVSLLAPCVMRFRRRIGDGFERIATPLAPRSAYLLTGPARSQWEHSIPPMDQLRYSVTFRTLPRA